MGSSKSKAKLVHFPEEILEQLRCSHCRSHLSCAPIRLLPDGSSVCGRCSVSNHNMLVIRETALEVALSRATFPCCYRQYGCPEQLLFGRTADHEAKCGYHPFTCPSLPSTTCSWQGSVVQVREHFYKSHPFLLRWSAEFQVDVHANKEDVLMILQDDATFMLKYIFDAASSKLCYDVRYFAVTTLVANYKIRLINSFNPDCNLNLKGNKCLPYNAGQTEMHGSTLMLSKYLEALDNPQEVTAQFQLPSLKIEQKPSNVRPIVNYIQLDLLRCIECQLYLTLPIFDSPKGAVCADCAQTNTACVPSKNQQLQQLVTDTNYPCRWNDCKFVAKGHSIRSHQIVCPFQSCKCPSAECKVLLTVASGPAMQLHLMFCHGYLFFSNRIVYSTKFGLHDERVMVTTNRSNELIVIKHCVTRNSHVFTLRSSRGTNVVAGIYFEHAHCKIKSRRFVVEASCELNVTAEVLPTCFRGDKKMSVAIEV